MTEPPNIPTAKVAPMEPAASDFQEDPFKNYRYEDPFMISDPFQEEAAVKGELLFLCNFKSQIK